MITTVPVLDHGFVKLLNISGPVRRLQCDAGVTESGETIWHDHDFDASDRDPAMAARMSFDQAGAERTHAQDIKLAAYLMEHKHTSPFEMIQVWLEMKLPIFVARQFVRHRTFRLNEVSARYVQLPREWYIPEAVGGKPPKGGAKQGQVDTLAAADQGLFKSALSQHCASGYALYQQALDMGVAPEHARMLLSLNHYTHWMLNVDMHNLMHFMALRDHSHAQVEAQAYARAVDVLVRQVLPETMALYDKFRRLP